MYLRYPLDNIWFSRGFTSSHKGVDIGWFSKYGQNMPIYAPGDGTVVAAIDGYDNTYDTGISNWGNYVKIYHGKNANGKAVYTLQGHMLKGSICVKVGDTVKQGQQIGRMNNSGYSNGSHDHSEVYIGGSGTAYRVNPVDWLYLYPGQYCEPDTKKNYGVKAYMPMANVGTPVERNTGVEQVEVLIDDLRARKRPEMNDAVVLGFVNSGIYNVLETRDMTAEASNGYLWYRVEADLWIATKEGDWTRHYEAQQQDDKDKRIAELEAELAKANAAAASAEAAAAEQQTRADGYKVIIDEAAAVLAKA